MGGGGALARRSIGTDTLLGPARSAVTAPLAHGAVRSLRSIFPGSGQEDSAAPLYR